MMTRIDAWDIERQAWMRSGGRLLEESEIVSIIIRMMPNALKQRIVLEMPGNTYADSGAFKVWLRERIRLMHTYKLGPLQSAVHVVEELDDGEVDEEALVAFVDANNLDAGDEAIMAVVRRAFQRRPGQRRPPGRPPPKTSPKSPPGGRESRCVNCGATGHSASACPKPRVELKDRPCFKCGKKGHTSSNCKSGMVPRRLRTTLNQTASRSRSTR